MDISSRIPISQDISGGLLDRKIDMARRFAVSGNTVKPGQDIKSTSRDFEAILVFKMMESMRSSLPKTDLFKSFSLDMYQSMMDQELANEMAKRRGIGLADMVYKQISKLEDKLGRAGSHAAPDMNAVGERLPAASLAESDL